MSDFKSDFEVIRTLGEPAMLEQLAEECSELAQAALKLARWAQRIREARGETPKEKKKTRQSEFLKMLPNVGMEEGVIDVCPKATEKNAICFRLNCKVCKKDYWLAEVD